MPLTFSVPPLVLGLSVALGGGLLIGLERERRKGAHPEEPLYTQQDVDATLPLFATVAWLASEESAGVTGRVFEVEGGIIGIAEGFRHGPRFDKGARWEPEEVGAVVADLIEEAATPTPVYGAS